MAKFLDTTGVSYHLEQLIKNAKERIIIISPYLKISSRIKELLDDKNRLKIDVRIVYRKNDLQPDENNWLKSLDFVRTSLCENLHAKCYLNEREAIITSMNLYEFSQINNNEMGIYITKTEDSQLFDDISTECQRLIRISNEIKISVEKVTPNSKNPININNGFCIRCKDKLKLDIGSPYCKECYKTWNKYGDEEYLEKYCHICGKDNESIIKKPVCKDCYKDNKKLFKS